MSSVSVEIEDRQATDFCVRVVALEGRNLLAKDATGKSDPYLKITVGGLTKRTKAIDQTLEPNWKEESLLFPIASFDDVIQVEVWDYDMMSHDDEMGSLSPIPVMLCPWWLETPSQQRAQRRPPSSLAASKSAAPAASSSAAQLSRTARKPSDPVWYTVLPPPGEKKSTAGEIALIIRREPRLSPGALSLQSLAVVSAPGVPVASLTFKIGGDSYKTKRAADYNAAAGRWEWPPDERLKIAVSEALLSEELVVIVRDKKKEPLGRVKVPLPALAENHLATPLLLLDPKNGKPAVATLPDGRIVSLSLCLTSALSSYTVRRKQTDLSSDKRVFRVQIDSHPLFTDANVSTGTTKAIVITPNTTALAARDAIIKQLARSVPPASRHAFVSGCQFFFLWQINEADPSKDRMLRTSEIIWNSLAPQASVALRQQSAAPASPAAQHAIGSSIVSSSSSSSSQSSSPSSSSSSSPLSTSERGSTMASSMAAQLPMFGTDLDSLQADVQTVGSIPNVVFDCVRFLRQHVQHHGLFRLSGSAAGVQRYIEQYDSRGTASFPPGELVDTVATLLKRFFSELPDSLLPMDKYDDVLSAVAAGLTVASVRRLFRSFSLERFTLCQFLFDFLATVASHHATNMMTASNLGVCFGPTLLRSTDDRDPMQIIAEQKYVNDFVAFVIANQPAVFAYFVLDGRPIESVFTIEECMGGMTIITDSFNYHHCARHYPLAAATRSSSSESITPRSTASDDGAASSSLSSSSLSLDSSELEELCLRLRNLRHPHVLPVTQLIFEDWQALERSRRDFGIWLISPHCHSTLVDVVCRDLFPFSELAVKQAARQLLMAIGYLHEQGFVHGEICADFIFAELEGTDGWSLKLACPGSSPHLLPPSKLAEVDGAAPEVVAGGKPTARSDVWSIACFIYVLASGKHYQHSKDARATDPLLSVKSPLSAFLAKLLRGKPAKRLDAEAAMQEPWLRSQTLSLSNLQMQSAVTGLRQLRKTSPKRRIKKSTVL